MDNMMKITVEEAEMLVVEGAERDSFESFLVKNGKEPHEWDYDDLAEFFRFKGEEV